MKSDLQSGPTTSCRLLAKNCKESFIAIVKWDTNECVMLQKLKKSIFFSFMMFNTFKCRVDFSLSVNRQIETFEAFKRYLKKSLAKKNVGSI